MYLPSPPQVLLGVIVTSLQESFLVLYTYNLRGRDSCASIKVNKSSLSWRMESAPII